MGDFIVTIILLNVTIITLGFVAPTFGLAAAIAWAAYGITRLIQELADRDNVV